MTYFSGIRKYCKFHFPSLDQMHLIFYILTRYFFGYHKNQLIILVLLVVITKYYSLVWVGQKQQCLSYLMVLKYLY